MADTRYQVVLPAGIRDLQTGKIIFKGMSEWNDYQAWVVGGGITLPPDNSGQYPTLAEAKLAKLEEMETHAAVLRNSVIRGRSVGEMASWGIKLMEALSILGSQPSPFSALMPAIATALGLPQTPTSLCQALGAQRGLTAAQFATKVVQQAAPFLAAEIAIDAARGVHRDAIEACTTIQQLIAYDWHSGWPNLSQGAG